MAARFRKISYFRSFKEIAESNNTSGFVLLADVDAISIDLLADEDFKISMMKCELFIILGDNTDYAEAIVDEFFERFHSDHVDTPPFAPTMGEDNFDDAMSVAETWDFTRDLEIYVLGAKT